ncbi:sizzled [Scleropages formosus]|uniref:sizzled n=1 Tax=Scleropages formosus TaxID=113540 RepID=UPI0010FA7F8E|nr:secreted frizzled-related protein 5-like [Scleropages formosus]
MLQLVRIVLVLVPVQGLAFDFGQFTRCVPIPRHMGICQDVGYSEMRLPNYLGQSSLETQVVPHSERWRPLLETGCHPQARVFLCSLLAPICLDTFIQPCRSLCAAVRDGCAPVLACQGQAWPDVLDCDRFPGHDDMCLSATITHGNIVLKGLPRATCQDCPATEEFPSLKSTMDAICLNDFAVKAKLARRRFASTETEFEVEGRLEFVRQGPLLLYDTRTMLEQWLLINPHCAQALVRPGRAQLYLVTGRVRPDGTLALALLFPWHKKDVNLVAASRKWKHHQC